MFRGRLEFGVAILLYVLAEFSVDHISENPRHTVLGRRIMITKLITNETLLELRSYVILQDDLRC